MEDYLAQQSLRRASRRAWRSSFPTRRSATRREPEYLARLEFEIKTITQMGFSGYFLIVADFINWAKSNAVPVGPGRGSGAGSLVAYSLGITDLDPLRYDLLFERFLNPGAGVDARLRHRFLPGRARPRHRVRASNKYGAESRVADRHLRHHGGEGGGARRRARAGMDLRPHSTSSPS